MIGTIAKDFNADTMSTVESSLVNVFEHSLAKKNNSKKIIIREFDCWQGRADLVTADLENLFIKTEFASAMANLTTAKIISLLHFRAPRTAKFIQERLGFSESTVQKGLNELIKIKAVKRMKNSYLLNDQIDIPNVEFNAYEAKLHDWRRALYQATQYFGFANYSWVVMPERNIKAALNNIKAFQYNKVGLISVDDYGKVKIQLRAKKNQPRRKAFHLVGIGKACLENFKY